MIGPGTGVRVYLACGATDMRKGIEGLAALSQDVLRQKATGGAVFAFRGRRGDRLKLLHWDGQGFCLYDKVLERGTTPYAVGRDRLAASGLGRATGQSWLDTALFLLVFMVFSWATWYELPCPIHP
jgi:transposase